MNTQKMIADAMLEIAKTTAADKITVSAVVKKSGVARGTFYKYFANINELFKWVCTSQLDKRIDKIGADGYGYYDFVLELITFIMQNVRFFRNVISNTYGNEAYYRKMSEHYFEVASANIIRRNGLKELPEDIVFYLRMFVYASAEMYGEQIFSQQPMDAESFALYLCRGMPEPLKPLILYTV